MQAKGILVRNASREREFHQGKCFDMSVNVGKLDARERYQEKNLKGLVNYAKKLTMELEDYKEKVKMAERIIRDLKNTGNESLDSLIVMLNEYKEKQIKTHEEIKKFKKILILKDNEIVGLDEDIEQLRVMVFYTLLV